MSRTPREYLHDLNHYIERVADFTKDGRDEFMKDDKTQFAVIRAYEVIGEIAKRLPQELLTTQPHIAWQDIKEFRDFLAHNYERIRLDIVWGAVEKLPELEVAVESMLISLDAPKDVQ